jgi:hypothetical protein
MRGETITNGLIRFSNDITFPFPIAAVRTSNINSTATAQGGIAGESVATAEAWLVTVMVSEAVNGA